MDWGLHLFDLFDLFELLHEIHLNPSVNFIETDVLDICFLSVVGMGNGGSLGSQILLQGDFFCFGDCRFLKKNRGGMTLANADMLAKPVLGFWRFLEIFGDFWRFLEVFGMD